MDQSPSQRNPEFKIIKTGPRNNQFVTYAVTIPYNDEGIAMLDEVGRMFSHRGEYDTAKRIANVVFEYKAGIKLDSSTEGTESGEKSEQTVQDTSKTPTCRTCGEEPRSDKHNRNRDLYAHDYRSPVKKTPGFHQPSIGKRVRPDYSTDSL